MSFPRKHIGVNLRNREIKLILDYNAIKANKIKQYSTPNGVPLSWDLCISTNISLLWSEGRRKDNSFRS